MGLGPVEQTITDDTRPGSLPVPMHGVTVGPSLIAGFATLRTPG